MATHGPTFSYAPVGNAIRDHIQMHVPINTIESSFNRLSRSNLRDDFRSIVKLAAKHFEKIDPDFYVDMAGQSYPVARDIRIPFETPFLYGKDGTLHVPWFCFWKSGALRGERLSLFVTLAREVLSRNPDLKDAKFYILDFGASHAPKGRELRIIQGENVPQLVSQKKNAMLEQFVIGYRLAQNEIANRRRTETSTRIVRVEAPAPSNDLFRSDSQDG